MKSAETAQPLIKINWIKNSQKSFAIFLGLSLFICFIHIQIENTIRGAIPNQSDSLAYQNRALNELHLLQQGLYAWQHFFFGTETLKFLPPLYKWCLQFAYLFFGISNIAPNILSGIWMWLVAFGVFLCIRQQTSDDWLAAFGGILILAIPAAVNFGFSSSRNDWPTAALLLFACYWIIQSDQFRSRFPSYMSGLFLGLALLMKSSTLGYVAFPALYIAGWFLVNRRNIDAAQWKNAAISAGLAILIAGWFYIVCYRDILFYYQFWANDMAPIVHQQYQLHSTWQNYSFYAVNHARQFGAFLSIFIVAGMMLHFLPPPFIKGRQQSNWFVQGLLVQFAIVPYAILIARQSFASPADINLLPFQALLAISGWQLALNRFHKIGLATMFFFGLHITSSSFIAHWQTPIYQGIDPNKTSDTMLARLSTIQPEYLSPNSVYEDSAFNADTFLHCIYMNPIYTQKFNPIRQTSMHHVMESTKLFTPARFEEYAHYGHPNNELEKTYKERSRYANVLFIANRPKGLSWIPVNQNHSAMKQLIDDDSRFIHIGSVEAYDDGTQLLLYLRQDIRLNLDEDGWLLDGAKIRLFTKPGKHRIQIAGGPQSPHLSQMWLVAQNQTRIDGKQIETGRFEFEIETSAEIEQFSIYGEDPLIPSAIATNQDSRRLLLLHPTGVFVP